MSPMHVTHADILDPSRFEGVSRRAALAGGAGTLAVVPVASGIRFGENHVTTGRPLASLSQMLGVCMVTSTTSGPWGQHDRILKALRRLGVTFVRSGLRTGNKGQVRWINELATHGIKINAIMGSPEAKAGTPEQLVALIAGSMPRAIRSMEGANEWNLEGGANWTSELTNHQTRLYRAAKGTAATRGIPVVGPSFGMRTGFDEWGYHGDIMDLGNMHLYTGGFAPGYRTDDLIKEVRKVAGSKPLFLSETGWHNARNSTATHKYTPEDVAGVYAPRLLLEYFIRNFKQLSIFELIDEPNDPSFTDHEAHLGLVRSDWSPKPALISLANMRQIYSRTYRSGGSAATPIGLRFDSGPPDLRSALVARPDGRQLLFLWRGVAIYDPIKRAYLNPKAATVTVTWSTPKRVRRYAPATSANALSSEVTSRSLLSLKGEMQILEISPA